MRAVAVLSLVVIAAALGAAARLPGTRSDASAFGVESLLTSAQHSPGEAARKLAVRKRHAGGKGGHCRPGSANPCRGGHRTWRRNSNSNNAAATTGASSGENIGKSSGNSCPTYPANFTEEHVKAIPIQQLIEASATLPSVEVDFIGRRCDHQTGPRTLTNGEIDLCTQDDKMGLYETKAKQKYGLYSADIRCPDNYLSGFANTFYLTNDRPQGSQNEIDIEFLNRLNTVMQVNIWVEGKSISFQNVFLPYNCAKEWHNYAILWTPQVIAMYIDNELKHFYPNTEALDGKKYPHSPMSHVASFWDGSWICDGCWTGKRESWTYGHEFVAKYRKVKRTPPIENAGCALSYL